MKKAVLEKSLDYMQFQNLIILTFCFVITLLAMLYSLDFGSYILIECFLFLFSLLFIAILFTKKGLIIIDENLYSGIFLFGKPIYKKIIPIIGFDCISIVKGKLSTNYAYSYKIDVFHKWEPDLNVSIKSFKICLIEENQKKIKKIITLTDSKKVKIAVDFIIENSTLKYVELY